jgi:hypothetical protein
MNLAFETEYTKPLFCLGRINCKANKVATYKTKAVQGSKKLP